jgi:hypothetical protein
MKPSGPKGPTRPTPPANTGIATKPLNSRLPALPEIGRLLPARTVNNIFLTPISTRLWKINKTFYGKESVPLFEALKSYLGPIAGDKEFSRRMDAVTHTRWVLESLEKIALSKDPGTAQKLFSGRGINGLPQSMPVIAELNKIYHSLNHNEQRILWLGAILHDIGKATGNRERHPWIGLQMYRKDPTLRKVIQMILFPTLTDAELEEAQTLIEFMIGLHDMLGGLAITRDRNIFESALAIIRVSKNQLIRKKLLDFLTLINFADIDAQSKDGIFTDQKIKYFYETYRSIKSMLQTAQNKEINSIQDLTDTKHTLVWWGGQRFLAWARGDTPGVPDRLAFTHLRNLLPKEQVRAKFYSILGKLQLFDGMYNLSTAIHDPKAAVKFLVWIAKIAGRNHIDIITYDNSFLTDPRISERIRSAARNNENFEDILNMVLTKAQGKITLRLSGNF